MKFSSFATFGVLAFASISAHAQYFSEGWKPGQPAEETTVAGAGATYTPGQALTKQQQQQPPVEKVQKPKRRSLFEYLDPDKLLGTVLEQFGVNVTAHLDKKIWDERIPLITDDNYKDVIVNEEFKSEQEARDRTWVIVVTVSGNKQEPLSKLVDDMFDSAYNKSIIAGDLPDVRWGRIDYFNVTYLTTKWNIWKAPYLIILKDRGQSLHFFRPGSIRVHDDSLLEFLRTQGYMKLPPWSGIWAPGGEREWLLELFAVYMTKVYNVITIFPKWILFIASGGIASVVLNFLHKSSNFGKPKAAVEAPSKDSNSRSNGVAASTSTQAGSTQAAVTEGTNGSPRSPVQASPAKRSSARQRKGKKATA